MPTAIHRFVLAVLMLTLVPSCAPPPGPPGPGEARGSIPDLRGSKAIVLPIQVKTGVPYDVTADEELTHSLRTRGEGVTWSFPPDLEEALRRSPGVTVPLRNMPVHIFLQTEVDRIGDPLFGYLTRLSGLTGANIALIPVELKYGEDGAFVLAAALVMIRTGRVAWFGVVGGSPGDARDPATLASVTETLARTLLPFG